MTKRHINTLCRLCAELEGLQNKLGAKEKQRVKDALATAKNALLDALRAR